MHASHTHALKAKIDYQLDSTSSTFKERKLAPGNNRLSFVSKLVHTCNLPFLTKTHQPNCDVIFRPSTLGSMRWLYLKVHMLLVKEKCEMYLHILNRVCNCKRIICLLHIIYDLELIDIFSKFKLSKSYNLMLRYHPPKPISK